jgi:hypothetical protein
MISFSRLDMDRSDGLTATLESEIESAGRCGEVCEVEGWEIESLVP